MSEMMVRKQVYLTRRHNLLLKRLAKQRGVSQAEVIRQALEHEAESTTPPRRDSFAAWDEIVRFVEERKTTLAGQGEAVRWKRENLYQEREDRWLKPDSD